MINTSELIKIKNCEFLLNKNKTDDYDIEIKLNNIFDIFNKIEIKLNSNIE